MTMGEPLSVYPMAMTTLAHTTTGPARWHPTRVTAALLAFVSVVLVIVCSFLPLYSGTIGFGGDEIEVTVSPWSADIDELGAPGDVPTIGYPLVFAAIVLSCAAALCWYAATPAASPGVGRVAGLTTAIAGAFLIGTVWTTALMVVNGVDSVFLLGTITPGLETEASYLAGHWLLLVAALVALVAAVFALVPVRQPTWAQLGVDVRTPPYGIAPFGGRGHQPPGVVHVDPLTGHPLPPAMPPGYQPFAQPQPHLLPQPQPPVVRPAAEPPATGTEQAPGDRPPPAPNP